MLYRLNLFGKKIEFEKSKSIDEIEDDISRDLMKLNAKKEAVVEETEPKINPGVTYQNCVFGQPFPVMVPQASQRVNGSLEEAIEYAAVQNGILDKETVQRIILTYNQYWEDRNPKQR